MYMYLSGVSEFVQAPTELGYGFGASVVVAGLCLVPFSVVGMLGARLLPLSTRLVGGRNLLPVGCLVVAAGGLVFAVFDDHLWGAFAMMGVLGLGYGLTYAAIPGIIVRAVPETETGSATGFYQVVRYIGFSLGSALAASLLASQTPAGSQLPDLAGYTTVIWSGSGSASPPPSSPGCCPPRPRATSPTRPSAAARRRKPSWRAPGCRASTRD